MLYENEYKMALHSLQWHSIMYVTHKAYYTWYTSAQVMSRVEWLHGLRRLNAAVASSVFHHHLHFRPVFPIHINVSSTNLVFNWTLADLVFDRVL